MSIFPEHFPENALAKWSGRSIFRGTFPDHFSGGAILAHGGQGPRMDLDRSPDATGQAQGPS